MSDQSDELLDLRLNSFLEDCERDRVEFRERIHRVESQEQLMLLRNEFLGRKQLEFLIQRTFFESILEPIVQLLVGFVIEQPVFVEQR